MNKNQINNKISEECFKIIFIGSSNAGKSKIISTFTGDNIKSKTVGMNIYIKYYDLEDKRIRVELWDSSGNKNYRTSINSFYKNFDAIVVVFDVTDKNSLFELNFWENELENYSSEKDLRYIVRNKIDLIRDSNISLDSTNMIEEFSPEETKHIDLNYKRKFSLTAMNDILVYKMFDFIIMDIYVKKHNIKLDIDFKSNKKRHGNRKSEDSNVSFNLVESNRIGSGSNLSIEKERSFKNSETNKPIKISSYENKTSNNGTNSSSSNCYY